MLFLCHKSPNRDLFFIILVSIDGFVISGALFAFEPNFLMFELVLGSSLQGRWRFCRRLLSLESYVVLRFWGFLCLAYV